jgi:hypothetical protein
VWGKEIGSATRLDILHIYVVVSDCIWGQYCFVGNGIKQMTERYTAEIIE